MIEHYFFVLVSAFLFAFALVAGLVSESPVLQALVLVILVFLVTATWGILDGSL